MVLEERLVASYNRVRGLPYDTVAAYDADSLRAQGRGNCAAKADLLAQELHDLGVPCRLVSWEYALPALVEVQRDLAFDSDVHTAVQARVGNRWLLVDATHDPALAKLGLTVGHWDAKSATQPAYAASGPVIVLDRHGQSPHLDQVNARIGRQVERTPAEAIAQYQHDLNLLFENARS